MYGCCDSCLYLNTSILQSGTITVIMHEMIFIILTYLYSSGGYRFSSVAIGSELLTTSWRLSGNVRFISSNSDFSFGLTFLASRDSILRCLLWDASSSMGYNWRGGGSWHLPLRKGWSCSSCLNI